MRTRLRHAAWRIPGFNSEKVASVYALIQTPNISAPTLGRDPGASYEPKTLGSLFAGIGGFDLGFELAGWHTAWQVELNPTNRAVLADRFPGAARHIDVREVGRHNLQRVECITAGFPCQDISLAGSRGKRLGLRGARSGLFYEVLRILEEIQPPWLVLENVAALLHSNNGEDLAAVVGELAQRGYVGFWRVLNAQYFGVPQQRRRIFLVAGFGRYPAFEFLADAAPVEAIPPSSASLPDAFKADGWAANTLTAKGAGSQISIGSEVLVAEEDAWNQMVERGRGIEDDGFLCGLDEANLAERFAAGNAVCPPVARWPLLIAVRVENLQILVFLVNVKIRNPLASLSDDGYGFIGRWK